MSDVPNNYDKARENLETYIYARDNGHIDYVTKANMCDAYFAGEQWEAEILAELRLSKRPALTINKVLPTISAVIGEHIQNRADVTFRPARGGVEDTAHALSKVFRQIANHNGLDQLEETVFEDGIITSRGYFDVRIDFNDHLEGEVKISVPNPRNVIPDIDADGYDPDTWSQCHITKWWSKHDIEEVYGKDAADEVQSFRGAEVSDIGYDFVDTGTFSQRERNDYREKPYGGDETLERRYRIIERQYKIIQRRPHFVDLATGDIRLIPQNWDREKIGNVMQQIEGLAVIDREVAVINWCVSCGHLMLHFEESPYRHFTVIPYFPYFRRGRTIGLVENIISPQDMLNKMRSQELHIVNGTSNSGWIVEEDSLANMDVEDLEVHGSRSGLVIVKRKGTADKAVEKIQPNNIPQGLDRMSFKADNDIKEVSGIGDSMRGMDRSDVSARAIEQKRQSGSINLTKPFESLATTRALLAKRVLSLVQSYYTEPRIIRFIGNDLTAETEEVPVNMVSPVGTIVNDLTIGEYDTIVVPAPKRATHDDSQFEELARMRQDLGIQIPDDVIIEHSHLTRKKEIAERVKQLTGGDLSDEHKRRMEEIEERREEAEMAKIEAEVMNIQAMARLTTMRAEKIMEEIQNPNISDDRLEELMLKAQQLDLNREKEMRALEIREQALQDRRIEMAHKIGQGQGKLLLEAQKRADESAQSRSQRNRSNSE